jgi:hypothetical protein
VNPHTPSSIAIWLRSSTAPTRIGCGGTKGIDLEVGRDVCQQVAALLNDRLMETLLGLKSRPMAEWTMLPAFAFSCDELAAGRDSPSKA